MKNLAIILLLSLAFVPACGNDPASPPPPDNSQKILPLTSREAVLNNLEVGWNKRSPSAIDDLLDDNFTFYFAPGDVGGSIPAQWGRANELAATTSLLESNKTTPPIAPVCRSVLVDLDLDGLTWIEVPIPASASASAEVWYTTTVVYTFTFEMEPDQTYSNNNAKAQLTVREAEGGWRLVEWRDIESNLLTLKEPSLTVDQSSWGKIKALYM